MPDIPLEEAVSVKAACQKAGIENILLTTPTTPEPRMAKIADATEGFVYLVSVTGVTGMKDQIENRVQGLIQALRRMTSKPIAVGFGVSRGEQVRCWLHCHDVQCSLPLLTLVSSIAGCPDCGLGRRRGDRGLGLGQGPG